MKPTYGAAILWIAENDNDWDNEGAEELSGYISVALVADLFGKSAAEVAQDVYALRNGSVMIKTYRMALQALKARGMDDSTAREYLEAGCKS
jgi:hypothetical protein